MALTIDSMALSAKSCSKHYIYNDLNIDHSVGKHDHTLQNYWHRCDQHVQLALKT